MATSHLKTRNGEIRRLELRWLVAVAVGCLLSSASALASNNPICDASDKRAPESFDSDLIRADDNASTLKAAKPLIADDRGRDMRRLSPTIEATLRDTDEPVSLSPDSADSEPTSPVNPPLTTRVPGLSDEAMARYKRYMYRKDI